MRGEAPPIREEAGFTLIEVLLALCISTLVLSGLSVALYQFNAVTRLHQNTLALNQQLQSTATVLNRDVVGASSGVAAGDSLSLCIPSYVFGQVADPITKTVTYAMASDTLTRSEDGQTVVIARHVEGVDFGPSGPISATLSITLTTTALGEARHTILVFDRRPSQ